MTVAASGTASRSFPARLDCAAEADAWLKQQTETLGIDRDATYALEVCLEEIFANLVLHGKASHATLRLTRKPTTAQLDIVDDGLLFDPTQAPARRVVGPLAEAEIGGLGIGLIQRLATTIAYRCDGGHNHLSLEFALTPSGKEHQGR